MENVIYEKVLEKNQELGTQLKVVLTKEVNAFVVWQVLWEGEDETLTVVKTFSNHPVYQATAIEFVVDFSTKHEKQKDSALVQRILRVVSGKSWNSETTERVASELRMAGYTVLDWEGQA